MSYPKIVYKYRDWNNSNHKKILLGQEMYFTSPKDFNDPFDCRITDDLSLITTEEIPGFIKIKVDIAIREGLFDESQSINASRQLRDKFIYLEKMQKEQDAITYQIQDDCYGIFSASARWNSILMWSHYANNHTGFCIGYKEEILRNYLIACGHLVKGGQISYAEEYPKMKPKPDFSPHDALMKAFKQTHTKSREWEYEEEYRIVKTISDPFTEEQRKIHIPLFCVSEVIIGMRIAKTHEDEITNFCKTNNIQSYKTKKVPFKFQIDRFPL